MLRLRLEARSACGAQQPPAASSNAMGRMPGASAGCQAMVVCPTFKTSYLDNQVLLSTFKILHTNTHTHTHILSPLPPSRAHAPQLSEPASVGTHKNLSHKVADRVHFNRCRHLGSVFIARWCRGFNGCSGNFMRRSGQWLRLCCAFAPLSTARK